jgi:hypothetical protein
LPIIDCLSEAVSQKDRQIVIIEPSVRSIFVVATEIPESGVR